MFLNQPRMDDPRVASRSVDTAASSSKLGREAHLYSEMTQASSAIIVVIKPSMEYAKPCMTIRLATFAIRHSLSV
jgi:hypothetical protein